MGFEENQEEYETEYAQKIDDETFGTQIFCKCGKKYKITFNIVTERFEVFEVKDE